MKTEFRKKLSQLINSESMENGSNTPDFILAEFLSDVLNAWDESVTAREKWYGREPKKVPSYEAPKEPSHSDDEHQLYAMRIVDLVHANQELFDAQPGHACLEAAFLTLKKLIATKGK